jgi:hypothetical protein
MTIFPRNQRLRITRNLVLAGDVLETLRNGLRSASASLSQARHPAAMIDGLRHSHVRPGF